MLLLAAISKNEEIAIAVVAILLLVMATFGLDAKVFRAKRAAKRRGGAPKQRVSFIVHREHVDSSSDKTGHETP